MPFPFRWQSSIFTGSDCGVAWRQSCFPILWRSSLWVEYSKYWKRIPSNQWPSCFREHLDLTILNFTRVSLSQHTWLPPMLWHWYMITGLPPWLFSPTSRQFWDLEFLIWCKYGQKNNSEIQPHFCNMYRVFYCSTYGQKETWLTAPNFSGVKSGMKASG